MPLGHRPPAGYERREVNGYNVTFSPAHSAWLLELSAHYDLVWASTWGDRANDAVGSVLGLPRLASVELVKDRWAETPKLASVVEFVGTRDCAWLDDELFLDAHKWAKNREVRTLLLKTSGYVGMTAEHYSQLLTFGRQGEPRPAGG